MKSHQALSSIRQEKANYGSSQVEISSDILDLILDQSPSPSPLIPPPRLRETSNIQPKDHSHHSSKNRENETNGGIRKNSRHDVGSEGRETHTDEEIKRQEMQFRSKLLGASGVSFNLLRLHPLASVDIKKVSYIEDFHMRVKLIIFVFCFVTPSYKSIVQFLARIQCQYRIS